MNVHGAGHAYGAVQKAASGRPDASNEVTGEQSEQDTSVESGVEGSGEVRGVIRNLQASHFKGVADVRLWINFSDELQALDAAAAEARDAVIDGFMSNVDGIVSGLGESFELSDEQAAAVDEAYSTFTGAVASIGSDEVAVAEADAEASPVDYEAALQAAFESFIAALHAALDPAPVEGPATEPTTDPVVEPGSGTTTDPATDPTSDPTVAVEATVVGDETPVVKPTVEETPVVEPAAPKGDVVVVAGETTEETVVDFSALYDALAGALSDALAELGGASSTSTLPELSEPTGNGVAYAKFLAIYNEMYGLPSANEGDGRDAEPVDIAA